jgi:hypothetical protein
MLTCGWQPYHRDWLAAGSSPGGVVFTGLALGMFRRLLHHTCGLATRWGRVRIASRVDCLTLFTGMLSCHRPRVTNRMDVE